MSFKIGKYIIGFLAMLLATGCATTNFEWIKVNPDKIQLAKNTAPYSDNIRRVDMVFELKEKDRVLYYPEPNGFFASEQSNQNQTNNKYPIKKNINRGIRFKKATESKQEKSVQIAVKQKSVADQPKPAVKNDSEADKLNAALKIPLNSNALKSGKKIGSFGSNSSEIREMTFDAIKKRNPELAQKSADNEQRGKNLMWAGLVLVVLGGVMGFIFGKSAFLISLAGAVFAGIGYFFRI